MDHSKEKNNLFNGVNILSSQMEVYLLNRSSLVRVDVCVCGGGGGGMCVGGEGGCVRGRGGWMCVGGEGGCVPEGRVDVGGRGGWMCVGCIHTLARKYSCC